MYQSSFPCCLEDKKQVKELLTKGGCGFLKSGCGQFEEWLMQLLGGWQGS